MTSARTIVLGAGPSGLACALLLAARGHDVTILEAAEQLDLDPTSSYPIGVNPRGQETLRRIDPVLLARLRTEGRWSRTSASTSGAAGWPACAAAP
ncbi:NAD(P)-binding protein [Brachybacterium sp. EF45031]|uniref:FAD-dependent oxidoreductase n=1 Tax=Brachybacterium sillae TaxID=2810536 RepID=UPI00217F170D|nr:FAD-dependent oxidoreductase [Brachybacterium sillae]MCS6711900.1 NAD(P)-binding protein [Brachybacterium sillae]